MTEPNTGFFAIYLLTPFLLGERFASSDLSSRFMFIFPISGCIPFFFLALTSRKTLKFYLGFLAVQIAYHMDSFSVGFCFYYC